MPTLLTCKCGDCAHWEVIHKDTDDDNSEAVLKCVTCKAEYKANVTVEDHDNLHYGPHEA